jgi:hypothetical protein
MNGRFKESYLLALLALLGAAFHFVIFFPGSMSVDSWNQIMQARSGVYADWHPPMMAFLWRLIETFWPGPTGMLVLHLTLFWYALFRFSVHLKSKYMFVRLAVLAIGLLPMVTGIIGAIWKDIGVGACGLLAYSYLCFPGPRKIEARLIALACFVYVIGVRRNGLFLAIPGRIR